VDVAWLEQARADASPDVLATAMQYIAGSSDLVTGDGTLLAADASYGPLQSDGTRQEGSDWNDLQGVTATYPDTTDAPEAQQLRSLDCSGFVRMLWGTRSGIPLGLRPDGGATLPRRAVQQASSAPGVVPVADTGAQVTDLRRLQPGDLVFFDASSDDGTAIDHVGVYLGLDGGGRHRFISSRKSADGPTMGDLRGASVLDGSGFYARAFRSTRRL
jgi:cell wall-associated NlpC family hydrolase